MSKIAFVVIVTSVLSSARAQTWSGPNQLQPVHGLYVKPSSDGTTGDLYVAATEESGSKAQWLTDQPINFLPAPAQHATQTVPIAFPSLPAHEEGSTTQKRAIMSAPTAPVHYTYAVPFNPTEGTQIQYPFPVSTPESPASPCEKAAAIPYNPYQFFYPQLMQAQAYANAKNLLKETGLSDEKASAVVPQASPFWPNGYSYPPYPMYVVMDPSAWVKAQQAQTASTAATVESSPK